VRKYVTTYVLNVILVACVLFTNMDDTVTPLDCHSVTKLVLGAEDAPKNYLLQFAFTETRYVDWKR